MGRFLIIGLACLWAMSCLSCHINEVSEDILELKLSDSLGTCDRLDIVLTNLAGTVELERIWNAAPPDPLVIRHVFTRARAADFLVKVSCVDSANEVRMVKTIPYRGGIRGNVHVVHGAKASYRIAAFKIIDSADADGDGHLRSYRTVLDVDANTNFDTLRMSLSYQVLGNPRWFPLIPSRFLSVTGAGTADTVVLATEGGARRTLNLKAVIRSAIGDTLDTALIAAVREETPGQDSAGLRWVFRNHTGAALTLDAEVGPVSLEDSVVERFDSVVVLLDAKSEDQRIRYAAVARGPGDPVTWRADSPMEMDRFDVEVEPLASDTHFVLTLLNRSGQTLTAVLLNPGSPDEKTYAVEIPDLPEFRNLGLFPYRTGTTLAFRLADGSLIAYNDVEFETHPVFGFRYADFDLD